MSMSAIIIGNESLAQSCAQKWLGAGHSIAAFVTRNDELADWARAQGLRVVASGTALASRLVETKADWLLSIANLDILPDDVLALPKRGAVNFHDGPLPRYAGLNAPVWARLNGERAHGITWHLIENGVDTGDVLVEAQYEINETDTALTLNTKAYEAAFESFDLLIAKLSSETLESKPQDTSLRSYFGKFERPEAFCWLDLRKPDASVIAFVLGLDHGPYFNPIGLPWIRHNGQLIYVTGAVKSGLPQSSAPAGTVLEVNKGSITCATGGAPVILKDLKDATGARVYPRESFARGDVIEALTDAEIDALSTAQADAVRGDFAWQKALQNLRPARIFECGKPSGPSRYQAQPLSLPDISHDVLMARVAGLVSGLSEDGEADLAFSSSTQSESEHLQSWVPLRYSDCFEENLKKARQVSVFSSSLAFRDPNIGSLEQPQIGVSDTDAPVAGCPLSLTRKGLVYDAALLGEAQVKLWARRIEALAALETLPEQPKDWPLIPQKERALTLEQWNATQKEYSATCIHEAFEAQVLRTPDAEALVFENQIFTYAELNARANQAAHVLREMGVQAGSLVGLAVHRSPELLIGALGILKAGGAYVPIDPAYPADRIALYIHDSEAQVIVTQKALAANLPNSAAQLLELDADPRLPDASSENLSPGAAPEDLAYLIYTSGSTGRPKGVMVEHGNVANFFAGMDGRVDHREGSVWLAVTSLSFDISVLELFYSLARGFKLVLAGDESRMLASDGRISMSDQGMEFGLFYWGNDDGPGKRKYHLLLEGAKFADQNGFSSIWTPERHFHAFGGPYPNPSVTGAAVAAVTKNIAVRSGSCVTPLHHPLRIAEEWAVIDNLTEGRAGLSIAAGWQPDDFVLRPENAPPHNKPAMFESLDILRKLWRGEAVSFPNGSGKDVDVITQPRPVSKELPIWVTTAGNPDTWREAGENGANVLTHLLGQSIDEVGGKIKIYREALAKAGHNPDEFTVTLMLHTYVAATREEARETARQPMKDYLNAAAGLIKQYAWAFPAFKKPQGVSNPFELDLEILAADELDAILEFAFERYFEDSGLFGTVDDCLDRVEELKRIGVDEIGCLIDYGIDPEIVLEGLRPLAEVHRLANAGYGAHEGDYSLAAQIVRHGVTHLQCTPSLARMLTMNEESRMALARVKHIMLGGEALSGDLVKELRSLTEAHIENMYGPTETTIWSTTETVREAADVINIGRPIANTQVYVLDDAGQPCGVGQTGELFIGGDGVTRGYWQREDLTAERFVENPFHRGRMYRTGDLVAWRSDGKLEFLGRADGQVKMRGYRIELGEIEARLHEQRGVRQAVVIAREFGEADLRLVAYLVSDQPIDEAALKAALAESLPEFMIPLHYVEIDAVPLTPNKKVDRKALPDPIAAAKAPVVVAASPERATPPKPSDADEIDVEIAEIWRATLGVQKIEPNDNFFDLGGHSLLAVQAHRAIREQCTVPRLSITDIFRFPTLEALAQRVRELGASVSGKKAETPKPAPKPQPDVSVDETMSRRRQMRARREMARAS